MRTRSLLTSLGIAAVWLAATSAVAQTPAPPRILPTPLDNANAAWSSPLGKTGLPNSSSALDQWLGALQPLADQPDARLRGFLREDSSLARDALCHDQTALTGPWGSLSELCLVSLLEQREGDPFSSLQAGASYGVALENIGWLDVNFGLGWLQDYRPAGGADHHLGAELGSSPELTGLALTPWPQLEGHYQTLSGQLWVSQRSWLRLTGSRVDLRGTVGPQLLYPQSWVSSSLSLDAGFGSFAGSLVGHRTRSPWRPEALFDVDLGISWRTPWSGKLTVGARNVLNSAEKTLQRQTEGDNPLLQARTPYVRYQQDL